MQAMANLDQGPVQTPGSPPPQPADQLAAGLKRLANDEAQTPVRLGARLRNYFLTGVIVVGPIAVTIFLIKWFIEFADEYVKPLIPSVYLPETYLPFAIPGIGVLFGFIGLTMIGFFAGKLLGQTFISFGEMMLDRMPIVRNVYRALKQIFESAVSAAGAGKSKPFQQVGLVEFPSKGLWSIVFVTGEAKGEIAAVSPGGNNDLLTVFMPTGMLPPTGFICFVPRRDVTLLQMSVEDAAKVVISGGMVSPDHQARLRQLAEKAAPPAPTP
jgi:uncharacterized membrane protein